MTINNWQIQNFMFTKQFCILLLTGLLSTPFTFSTGHAKELSSETLYTIKAGDTLWSISQTFLHNANNWKKLQTLNNIKNPNRLIPNNTLRIPSIFLKPETVISNDKANPQKSATIKNIQGIATIITKDGKEKNAKLGMNIYEGDKITTHTESSVQLEFKSGSFSNLQENSQLIITTLKSLQTHITNTNKTTEEKISAQKKPRKTQLHLLNGTITNDVKKLTPDSQFIITTPSAVASVRGTIFRVASNPLTQQFRTEVLEGRVAVNNEGKSIIIKKGFGIIVKDGQQPERPQKLLDAANLSHLQPSFDQTPVFFQFPQVENAIAYRIEVSKLPLGKPISFQQQIFSKNITKPSIRLTHLKNGQYIMRVFSYDKNGLGGKVAYHQFSINVPSQEEPLKVPTLVSPDDLALVNEKDFHFSWKKTNPSTNYGYHFQLAKDPGFNQLLIDIFPYYFNKLAISDRLPSGRYYWHVGALNSQNKVHSYTDLRSFRLLPPTPVIIEPKYNNHVIQIAWHTNNNEIGHKNNKSLTGTRTSVSIDTNITPVKQPVKQKNLLTTTKFRLQIATDKHFTNPIIDTTLSENHYELPRKTLGELFIKVTSIGADGYSSRSGKIQHLRLEQKGFFNQKLVNINH